VARIISRARQLRFQLQLKEGRTIPVVEVAERAGVDRKALTRLEENKTERFDGEMLEKLCTFCGVGVGDILVYVAEEHQKNRAPHGQLAFQS